MKSNNLLVLVGFAVAWPGCAGPSTVYHYDSLADFERLQTYAWLPVQMPGSGNRFVEGIFTSATDAALQAKGYREVTENPDFRVSMYLGKITRSEVTDPGYRAEGWEGAVHTHIYEEGTLIMDILEGSTGKVIWHGKATQPMNTGASQAEMEQAHHEAIAALLRNFPPPQPGSAKGAGALAHVRGR